jgi:hypothetical protein
MDVDALFNREDGAADGDASFVMARLALEDGAQQAGGKEGEDEEEGAGAITKAGLTPEQVGRWSLLSACSVQGCQQAHKGDLHLH